MFYTVREDSGRTSPRSWGLKGFIRQGLGVCTILATCLTTVEVCAQANNAQQGFKATVMDASGSIQRVTVPQFRSVTVETTVEVSRADVMASHIADVQVISPKRLYVTGKSYGNTSVILMAGDQKQYTLDVTVELDLERLTESLRSVDPLSKVEAKSVLGNIVLTGTASNAARAKRMVELAQVFLPRYPDGRPSTSTVQNYLEVAGEQQVLLRCVVAEVNRSAVRELGVNGFLAGDDFRDAFLVNQLGGINPINIGAAADASAVGTIPFLTGSDGIPISPANTLSLGFPRVQMQLFLKAMQDNSLLNILAEPNLVAISGETASFLAGGEFPIPVPQGNQQITIEFREFGVRLNFTPVVLGQQMIRLRVAPEVSELDFSTSVQIEGFVVPGLTARATETTVELGSGQTIAIAGLLNEQIRGFASRIPGLGDVPVLGGLFRSVNYKRSLTELVILVTPEVVAPLDAHQTVKLPGSDKKDPNDFELYALGLIEGGLLEKRKKDAEGAAPDASEQVSIQRDELSIHGPWGHAGMVEQ